METLKLFATLLPMAVSSGINLYATVLVAGLAIHFQWVKDTPAGLDALGTWPVMIIAGVFFILEALADKIQFVDNVWDMIHTVIRPLGAMFIGVALLGKADPVIMMIAVMFAGSVALAAHGSKAGGRIAMNVVSPAENIKNIAISSAEDVGAGLLTFTALRYPYEAMVLAIGILALMAIVVPPLLRWAWYVVSGLFTLLKSLGQKLIMSEVRSDPLPSSHLTLVRHKRPAITSRCKAQNIRGANGRSGFLSVLDNRLVFSYNTLTGSHLWQTDLNQVVAHYFTRRVFMDVLEIHYLDSKQKDRKAMFAFLKDRTPLAEQFIRLLEQNTPG